MKRTIAHLALCSVLALAATTLPLTAGSHDNTIVDVARSAGSFETLLAAATAAGLVDTLKGDGPFTIFAPTDEAFAKLPKATLESLLRPENKSVLAEILTYHVVSGSVSARQAASLDRANTLANQVVMIDIDGGQLRINDARVVSNDIAASNGVVHVIDTVLIPGSAAQSLSKQGRKVIGAYISSPDRALAAQLGIDRREALVVDRLTSRGAAQNALERYDVITFIDGRPATESELDRAKKRATAGDTIEMTLLRSGRSIAVDVPVLLADH